MRYSRTGYVANRYGDALLQGKTHQSLNELTHVFNTAHSQHQCKNN